MDAISPPVQALLELFQDSFADVRFGDIEAKSLSSEADAVRAAAAVVAQAEQALAEARELLNSRNDSLLVLAQRALAYARVYAEPDEALSTRVAAIALPRPVRRFKPNGEPLILQAEADAPPRKRGRPRKVDAAMNPELLT